MTYELLKKKQVYFENIEYFVDLLKIDDWSNNEKTYYVYKVFIYSREEKRNFFGTIKTKYNLLNTYKTSWMEYFTYKGEIDKVLAEAFAEIRDNKNARIFMESKEKMSLENIERIVL